MNPIVAPIKNLKKSVLVIVILVIFLFHPGKSMSMPSSLSSDEELLLKNIQELIDQSYKFSLDLRTKRFQLPPETRSNKSRQFYFNSLISQYPKNQGLKPAFWRDKPEIFTTINDLSSEERLIYYKINSSVYDEIEKFFEEKELLVQDKIEQDELNDVWYEVAVRSEANQEHFKLNFNLFDFFKKNDLLQNQPKSHVTFYKFLLAKDLYSEQEKVLYRILPKKLSKSIKYLKVALANVKFSQSVELQNPFSPFNIRSVKNRNLKLRSYKELNSRLREIHLILNELETRFEELIVFKKLVLNHYSNEKALNIANGFCSYGDRIHLLNIHKELNQPMVLSFQDETKFLEKLKILKNRKRTTTILSAEKIEDENILLKEFAKKNSYQRISFLPLGTEKKQRIDLPRIKQNQAIGIEKRPIQKLELKKNKRIGDNLQIIALNQKKNQ